MKETPASIIGVVFKTRRIAVFFPLLAKGFRVPCRADATLHRFLRSDLGLDGDYIEDRLQTIFLNGKPVDDLSTAVVADGATLALSAAMPGLVGATFRRGGRYAAMRRPISHKANERSGAAKAGIVTVKLFNLIAEEIGPKLLGKGILLPGPDFAAFIEKQAEDFWQGNRSVRLDNREVQKEELLGMRFDRNTVALRVLPDAHV